MQQGATMPTTTVQSLNATDFDAFIDSDTPTLVDFWAPWCGPCNALSPTINTLADDLEGKAQVAKVNIDENKDLAVKYQIASIPTVLVFKNGQLTDTLVGIRQRADYERALLG